MVDVVWSADCDGVYVAKRHTTLLPPWAGIEDNAETVAKMICEDFFDARVWDEWIGYDNSWSVQVELHSPPSIAGLYDVDLDRVTKATAYRRKRPVKVDNHPAPADHQ